MEQNSDDKNFPAKLEVEPDIEKLRAYTQIKFALADQLRIMRQGFIALGRDNAERQCSELMVKLAEDRFILAVLGQFKRGKSSLMNAIIGREILPTGVLPLTSAITILKYGSEERLVITHVNSPFPEEYSVTELAEFVTEKKNPNNEKKIKTASVELPLPFLRYGLEFVDTPGVGSAITANTETTYSFLPECDAVLFVTGIDTPMTNVELEFLKEIKQYVNKIFFVVNKIDLVSEEEQKEGLQFVTETIQKNIGKEAVKIFPVSSRMALQQETSGEAPFYKLSGLKELEESLSSFLSEEKSSAFLAAIAQKALRIIDIEMAQKVFEEPYLQSRIIAIREEKPVRIYTDVHVAASAVIAARTKFEALYNNILYEGIKVVSKIEEPTVIEKAKIEKTEVQKAANPNLLEENISKDLQTRTCPVCQHIAHQAFDFFAHLQYQLSTDEKVQNDFAAELGFCPLHLWQLLAISSPQGASVGFARLAEKISHLLKQNKNNFLNGDWVNGLIQNYTTCRVCILLKKAGEDYIQKLHEALNESSGRNQYEHSQGVCLRHLSMLMKAASGKEIREFLLSHSAKLFEQDAEDMRSYVLKVDALRRGLQNRNEEDAYRRSVIRMAGDKRVCMP